MLGAVGPAAEAWLRLSDTVTMGSPEPGARWPEHLPVGALRVVRWSARYDQTISFCRDIIGLPVLETFHNSYGLDGTILDCPAVPFTWRSSVWATPGTRRLGLISWCSTCPMPAPGSGSPRGWLR